MNFENSLGEALHEEVELKGKIDTTLDLTKEEKITEVLKELTNQKYRITDRPGNEQAFLIKEVSNKVTYKLTGTLGIQSSPHLL